MGAALTNRLIYEGFRFLGMPFRFRVIGLENVQHVGPALYVANHLGSLGPVQIILSLPMRLYPWVIADMCDYRRAPSYLYDDFIHPTLRLSGRFGRLASWVIGHAAVWLIHGISAVPIESNSKALFDGSMGRSLSLLTAGKSLLVFPEDRKRELVDPIMDLYRFTCGFSWLCYLYEQATGRCLPIYPLAVSPQRKTITIGKAVCWEDRGDRRQGLRALCEDLQERVRVLYYSVEPASEN